MCAGYDAHARISAALRLGPAAPHSAPVHPAPTEPEPVCRSSAPHDASWIAAAHHEQQGGERACAVGKRHDVALALKFSLECVECVDGFIKRIWKYEVGLIAINKTLMHVNIPQWASSSFILFTHLSNTSCSSCSLPRWTWKDFSFLISPTTHLEYPAAPTGERPFTRSTYSTTTWSLSPSSWVLFDK